MSRSKTSSPKTVILTDDARSIPRSTLASGALIIEDADTFRALVADPAMAGYVNLAGAYSLEGFEQFENVHLYAPLASLAEISERVSRTFAQYSLQLEDSFVWFRRGDTLRNSIDMALHLHAWRERYDDSRESLREADSSGDALKPSAAPAPLLKNAELLGRKIYPQLPKPLQTMGLKAWYLVSGRLAK